MKQNGFLQKPDLTVGLLFSLLAVVIWAAWLPATQVAIDEGIAPLDLALLRFVVPAVLLAPVWWQLGVVPKVAPVALLAMMGWGAPFVILVSIGLENASVAHTAAMVPCTMPLIAAVAARVFLGERIGRDRWFGMALIGVAAACVLLPVVFSGSGATLERMGLLLLASAGWAAFTVAFRYSGLTGLQATALVSLYSTVLLLPALYVAGSSLGGRSAGALVFHLTAQGLLSGFVATLAYALAIKRLGASTAASFSVLVPVLATVFAFFWLGEIPSGLDAFALGIGSAGVAIVTGALRLSRDLRG